MALVHARQLRSRQTDSEQKLWYHLRAHRFLGLKFKRQRPIGPYIADFVCEEMHLVIELDGGQHNSAQHYDDARSAFLLSKGYRVLRFWNPDVLNRTEEVLQAIRLACDEALSLGDWRLPRAGEEGTAEPPVPAQRERAGDRAAPHTRSPVKEKT